MSPALDLGDLDRFTVGTEGPVGERVFLLQCRSGLTVVTLKAEKQQVSVLAEYLGRLLADLDRPEDLPIDLELEEPTDPHWVIGTLGVSYDEALDRIVLVAEELVAEDEEGDMARFTITRSQAAAFAIRATTLVEAGRPPVPVVRRPPRPFRTRVPEDQRPPAARHLRLLAEGDVEIVGRMPWSSNHTFLVTCTSGDEEASAVYKPGRGERHLWDFPEAIYRREVAAYELSRPSGGTSSPRPSSATTLPSGPGRCSCSSPPTSPSTISPWSRNEEYHDQLRAICAFDVVANNADRKSGHCILGDDGRIWAIDNGLCFHAEPKLRTVIWEFAGKPSRRTLTDDLARVAQSPPEGLRAAAVGARGAGRAPPGRGAARARDGSRSPTPTPTTTPGRWSDPVDYPCWPPV